MGAGMARSLHREGHEVAVWNRTREKADALTPDGITVAESVTAAVEGADAVITMLFDTDATLAVRDELVAALGADSVWIQSATLGPDGVRRVAADERRFLDVPVVGTKKPAEEGALVVLVSGAHELAERVRPVFDAIGGKTVVAGDEIGQASALKLACNAWVAMLTAGTAQSLALAQQLGVDPELFLTTIEGGPADSAYAQLKGKAMLAGDFTTSFSVDGLSKDLGLIIDAGTAAGLPTEIVSAVRSRFDAASSLGHGDDDLAAVRTAFPS